LSKERQYVLLLGGQNGFGHKLYAGVLFARLQFRSGFGRVRVGYGAGCGK
jgi:hypothetical protein